MVESQVGIDDSIDSLSLMLYRSAILPHLHSRRQLKDVRITAKLTQVVGTEALLENLHHAVSLSYSLVLKSLASILK